MRKVDKPSRSATMSGMPSLELRATTGEVPERVLSGYARVLGANPDARVSRPTENVLIIEERWRPLWTLLVAVILFPFGLPALLHRVTLRVTVSATPYGDHTAVAVTGSARRASVRAYQDLTEWFGSQAGARV